MITVDLHMHTTASDGRLTPTELVNLANQKGLKTISITDHDSTEGLEEALLAADSFPELTIIPGIELSTDIPGDEIHMLAYFIRYQDPLVQKTLKHFREGRLDRAKRMVDKLCDLGLEIEWERVQSIAGDAAVGRPHIALALLEKKYISNINEAFDKYIGRNGPAYAERKKLTPDEAIDMVKKWGGVSVLAHPAHIENLDETLAHLKSVGLSGMEVYYAEYNTDTIKNLARLANKHELLPCGGSDYHALKKPNECLPGTMGPPMSTVDKLRDLAT